MDDAALPPDITANDLLALLHQLADTAAPETTGRFRRELFVENKEAAGFDPVTAADQQAEAAIRAVLDAHRPEDGILGEEHGEKPSQNGLRWVIDPVDGTRAYICGVPTWTTLIGLEWQGVPVAGVLDQPILGERWIGGSAVGVSHHQKATHTDGTPVLSQTSGCTTLAEAKMMVTDIRAGEYLQADEAERVAGLADQVRLLRQGLDSYGFALVASGHMDLVVEAGLSWYDIAAVIPIIESAGGVVTTWDGSLVREASCCPAGRGRIIAAATPTLAGEVRNLLDG